MRNVFLEIDAQVRLQPDFGAEQSRRAHDEVGVVGWDGRIVAGKLEATIVAGLHVESVEDADRNEQGVDVLESIVAPPQDAEVREPSTTSWFDELDSVTAELPPVEKR